MYIYAYSHTTLYTQFISCVHASEHVSPRHWMLFIIARSRMTIRQRESERNKTLINHPHTLSLEQTPAKSVVRALRPRNVFTRQRERGTRILSISISLSLVLNAAAVSNASRIRHRTKRRREFTLIRLMAAMKVGLRQAIIFMWFSLLFHFRPSAAAERARC